MEQVATHRTTLHDKDRLAGHGAGYTLRNVPARYEAACRTQSMARLTEYPCTIGNGLQDTKRVTPHGMPLHDSKRLAGHGAGHASRNVPAR